MAVTQGEPDSERPFTLDGMRSGRGYRDDFHPKQGHLVLIVNAFPCSHSSQRWCNHKCVKQLELPPRPYQGCGYYIATAPSNVAVINSSTDGMELRAKVVRRRYYWTRG